MKLFEKIKGYFGEMGLENLEIPLHILENLNANIELREYQINALKYYIANFQKFHHSHLMFHMATGSGKTVMMAALILDCFARGYENFVFFVNSSAIVEKTKQNFSNARSSKYLFNKNILIDSKNISINICDNLNTCKKGQINITFTTVQSLFSLLTLERENALTIADFKDKKIVMLADEAHHINADTKKNKRDEEDFRSWEGVTSAIYKANSENLMFEFSATLPKDRNVQQKYEDKIIFEYTLKEFNKDKYSKNVRLLKYEGLEREKRMLGAVICSLYRQHLAAQYQIFLKPVILFKSKTIKESKENEELFLRWLRELKLEDLEGFFENIKEGSGILYEAKIFFYNKRIEELLREIKREFESHFIININDINELQNNQILINTLEDESNKIRVIFAVDKLNEGWDVLNLFDIVRLIEGSINDTPKEAQLIGRGARYFPFLVQEFSNMKRNQRKFDGCNSPLKALETLSYHGASENDFITRLERELVEIGLKDDDKETVKLVLKDEFKQSEIYQNAFFATNSVMRVKDEIKNPKNTSGYFTLESIEKLKIHQEPMKIPLIDAHNIEEQNMIKAISEAPQMQTSEIRKGFEFEDLDNAIILKAMNKSGEFYTFENLKLLFKDIQSRQDFINTYFKSIKLNIHNNQNISSPQTKLKIALLVCESFKNEIEKKLQDFEVKQWHLTPLKLIGDKIITRAKDTEVHDMSIYTKFAFKNFVGTKLEKDFVNFVQENATKLDEKFSQWWLVRNERNAQMAIYIRSDEEENKAKRFEPDFYFFAKPKGSKDFEILQCFIEPKGGHLADIDKWKEEFLKSLLEAPKMVENDEKGYYRQKVKVMGMPFFTEGKRNEFDKSFVRILQM